MAIFYEGFRYDITTIGPNSGSDSRLVGKAGTLDLYRKGARVTAPSSGGPGDVVVVIADPGTIVPGDTVQINGTGATGIVQTASYTPITLTVNWSAPASWVAGDRVVVTNTRPVGFSDPYLGTSLGSSIAFGATTGLGTFYSPTSQLDIIRTVDGITDLLVDQTGLGAGLTVSPLDVGGKADSVVDDALAVQDRVTYLATRGRGVIELPPGDLAWLTTVTIDGLTGGLVIRGQGRGVTRLVGASHATIMVSLLNSSDVVFENLTIGRIAAAANQPCISIANTCSRVRFQKVQFSNPGIALQDSGTDTTLDDVYLNGSAAKGIYLLNSVRPKLRTIISRIASNLAATDAIVDIDGATSAHLDQVDIKPSASNITGSAIRVRGAAADVRVTASALSGGDDAGGPRAAILIENGSGHSILGTTMEDSLTGLLLTGTNVGSLSMADCTVVGMRQHGITVTGDYTSLMISSHKSSNVGEAGANTYDHINVEPAGAGSIWLTKISDVHYGNFIRGAGNSARHAVLTNQFANPPEIRGVHGDISTLGSDPMNIAAATIPSLSHSAEASTNTERHSAVAWPSVNTASATPDVRKRKQVRITAAAPFTVTDFLNGSGGQTITVFNLTGGTLTIDCTGTNIISKDGSDISMTNPSGRSFERDGTSNVWREV